LIIIINTHEVLVYTVIICSIIFSFNNAFAESLSVIVDISTTKIPHSII